MPNNPERPSYRIYLLTVWLLPGAGPGVASRWRFRLEDPRSGERRGFTSAHELVAALHMLDEAGFVDVQGQQLIP